MFDIQRFVFHRNRLFHRNDMHSDAGAARRHHGGHMLQRQEGHPLKEHGQLRMPVHQLLVHVGIFGRAGDKQRNPVFAVFLLPRHIRQRAVLRILVAVVIFQHTQHAEPLQQRIAFLPLSRFLGPGHAEHLRIGILLPQLHLQHQVQRCLRFLRGEFILKNTGQAPIFRVLGRDSLQFGGNPVGDFPNQL